MSPEPTVSSIVVKADDSPETAYTGGNWIGGEGIVRELCSFLYVNAFFRTFFLIQYLLPAIDRVFRQRSLPRFPHHQRHSPHEQTLDTKGTY